MLKATVLCGQPENPGAFKKYYTETHILLQIKFPTFTILNLSFSLRTPMDQNRLITVWLNYILLMPH